MRASISDEYNDSNLSDMPPRLSDLGFGSDRIISDENGTCGFEVKNIDKFYTPKVVVGCDMPIISLEEIQKYDSRCKKIREILILYTGGTIGMRKKDGAYEPEPNYLTKALRRLPMFNDSRLRKDLPSLNEVFVMPRSQDDVRVLFNVWEYSPLLDSSDMTMDDYMRISKDILQQYNNYDGFIILHGTDTMSFTGSALSFIFENLTKPVILTGSQIPLFELRSDGRENLLASLIICSHYHIPEVTVFFHEHLYRANRTTKQSSCHFDAFNSPNYPPLAELGISINVFEHRLFKRPKSNNFLGSYVPSSLSPNVTVLRMFPSITCATVSAFLAPPVEGIVLQTYGSGNMPFCRKDLLQLFLDAYNRGCIIVNITQCWKGGVKAIYRTGFILKEYGIFPGLDMTVEAALTKLSYVLARTDWSLETKRTAMTRNLRGEMTIGHYDAKRNFRSLSQDDIMIDQECIVAATLCNSAKDGNVPLLEQLGRRRGNWEAADYDSRTALHIGASENQLEVVKFLIEMNCDLNKKDRYGCTPLRCAVNMGSNPELIKSLVEGGASLNMTPQQIRTELMTAIYDNNVNLLESYYYAGVSVNAIDENGNSLLHEAAMLGRIDIAKRLLEYGCDPLQRNKIGNTASEEARIREYNQIAGVINEFKALDSLLSD